MLAELIIGLIAFVLIITIPGYFLTLAFFPSKIEIDGIERLAFSFVFSISFLPLIMLIENQLLSIRINFFTVATSLLLLIIASLLIYLIRIQKIPVPEIFYKIFPKIEQGEAVEIVPRIR